MVLTMQVVEIALVVVKVVNLRANLVKNLHDGIAVNPAILDMILSVKNLVKANQVVRNLIKHRSAINLRNLKVNVNEIGIYGETI